MLLEGLAGTLIGSLSKTEGAKQASKEMSVAIWEWIRPLFLKEVDEEQKEVVATFEAEPDKKENQEKVKALLVEYLKQHAKEANELKTRMNHGNPGSVINNAPVGKQIINPIVGGNIQM